MQFPDSTGGKVMKPQSTAKAWYEFAGCALLPLRPAEQDAPHVRSIIADVQGLESCGFPSLLPDALAPPCAELIRRAGVEL
eukprot:CAMPEP_0174858536 /NCGR_PEP_ID=MMETSP1114-20130205/43001_1 /TAXON_ID=312471 /ORGANISM="Neobodo designis, Strain CCAP 1951/1" /LENGTH=80 /DNA_ID=CAMNT_0016093443 /DNA_START=125 /DNA_END=363 /DNA_ORIENTATION=-